MYLNTISRALGVLTSLTLVTAMLCNLILLPSLLLSFQRALTTKAFSEPFVHIIDEEDDLDYTDWQVRRIDPTLDELREDELES